MVAVIQGGLTHRVQAHWAGGGWRWEEARAPALASGVSPRRSGYPSDETLPRTLARGRRKVCQNRRSNASLLPSSAARDMLAVFEQVIDRGLSQFSWLR